MAHLCLSSAFPEGCVRQPFSETNLVLLMALLSADRAFVIFIHQKCENLSEHKGSWRLQKEWTSMGFQKIGVNRSNNVGKKKLVDPTQHISNTVSYIVGETANVQSLQIATRNRGRTWGKRTK